MGGSVNLQLSPIGQGLDPQVATQIAGVGDQLDQWLEGVMIHDVFPLLAAGVAPPASTSLPLMLSTANEMFPLNLASSLTTVLTARYGNDPGIATLVESIENAMQLWKETTTIILMSVNTPGTGATPQGASLGNLLPVTTVHQGVWAAV